MKIVRFRIDGFGVFHDHDSGELSPGLNIFLGANEAGKSTLLAFLRGMIFGFDEGENGFALHPPGPNGRHGGLVEIERDGERWILERRLGRRPRTRLLRADGTEASLDRLGEWLRGVDAHTFRSVWAFSLTELQTLSSLTGSALRERLRSTALAGEGVRGRDALAELAREAEAWSPLRPAARTNELVRALDDVRTELERARAESAAAHSVVDQIDAVSREIDGLHESSEALRAEIARLERLIATRPFLDEVKRLETRRRSLVDPARVTPAVRSRWERLCAERERLAGELRRAETEQEALESTRAGIASRTDDRAHGRSADFATLHNDLAVHRRRLGERSEADAALGDLEKRLRSELARIGLDESGLRALDTKALAADLGARRKDVAACREALESIARDEASISEQATAIDRELSAARTARDALDAPRDDVIAARESSLWRARGTVVELTAAQAARTAGTRRVEELARDLSAAESTKVPTLPGGLVLGAFLVAVGAVIAAVVLASLERPDGVLPCLIGALVFAVGGFVLRGQRVRGLAGARQQSEVCERLRSELTSSRARESAETERCAALESRLAEDAQTLGIAEQLGTEQLRTEHLASAESDLRAARELRQRRDTASARVAGIEAKLASIRQEQSANTERRAQAEARLESALVAWRDALGSRGLTGDTSPENSSALEDAIDRARRDLSRVETLRQQSETAREPVSAWESRAQSLLAETGDPTARETSAGGLVARFLALKERLDTDHAARIELAAADARLESHRERVETLRRAREDVEKGVASLLGELGASSESDIGERLDSADLARSLDQRLEDARAALSERLDACGDPVAERSSLHAGDVPAWQDEIARTTLRLRHVDEQRDAAQRLRGERERELASLEISPAIASLELEESALVAEIASDANVWRELRAAHALVEIAMERLESTRQPRILAEAASIFETVTEGRYIALRQSPTGRDLVVVERDGKEKSTSHLSRGTAEQLYLALRLALVREAAREGTKIPVVLDDVLVNFDPTRARSMARALLDLASDEQVFLFSSQPTTVELFGDDGRATVFELAGRPTRAKA